MVEKEDSVAVLAYYGTPPGDIEAEQIHIGNFRAKRGNPACTNSNPKKGLIQIRLVRQKSKKSKKNKSREFTF